MVKEQEDKPKRMNAVRLCLNEGRIELQSSELDMKELISLLLGLKEHFTDKEKEEKEKENPIVG